MLITHYIVRILVQTFRNTYEIAKEIAQLERRTQWQKKRDRALLLVGKGRVECVRCGCKDPKFLEINHKFGGGNKEYKQDKIRLAASILYHNRAVDDLELLCKPCNTIHYLEQKHNQKIPLSVHFQNNDWEQEL